MRKFVRTRGQPRPPAPPAPLTPPAVSDIHTLKTNGHANGVNVARREDQHSTLSRYWSESERSGGAEPGAAGVLFEDEEFPPTWRSLGEKKMAHGVQWVRPHELCARPRFLGDSVVEGRASPEDDEPPDEFNARWGVAVGELGDTWLCSAASALAATPRLLARAVPPHSFTYPHYTGEFRFQFWVFGSWREITVDDRLPTRAGRLLASAGRLPHDYTLALLEKAHAKLHGSYVAARSGSAARALRELSGGIVQSLELGRMPRGVTRQLLQAALPRASLLLAIPALQAKDSSDRGWRELPGGLLSALPYCVTGLARVRAPPAAEGVMLVRLRAAGVAGPEARGAWRGVWARGSDEWRQLQPRDRELLHTDTDMWMALWSLCGAFGSLCALHVGPDEWVRERGLRARGPWRAVLARRRWRAASAGGPPAAETTSINPQFHLTVGRCTDAHQRCHVIVSVMPGPGGPGGRVDARGVGFALYELPGSAPPGPAPLHTLRLLDVSTCGGGGGGAQEAATFYTLPRGRYLVVPHARAAEQRAFLLRIYTDEQADVWEVNDDNMIVRDITAEFLDAAQASPPELRTSISKLIGKNHGDEVSHAALQRALRGARACDAGLRAASRAARRDVCAALLAWRDAALSGAMPARDVPAVLAVLLFWKGVYLQWCEGGVCGAGRGVAAARLRGVLRACGVTVSNKVLELCAVRWGARLPLPALQLVLARLHLAHERYRNLDTKTKSNPLSLEEMILMTIYS